MSAPDRGRVFLSPPDVGELERSYVMAAIDSNWVAPMGPDVEAFEAELAAVAGRRCAVAVSSGTAGLHLSLLASGVGPGDRVAVSTFTFAATANAIVYTGAEPVFVDSSASSWNLDPGLLADALEAGRRTGRPIRAVVAVDLYGQTCDYDAIAALCEEFDTAFISDAAEALGAHYRDRPAGSAGRAAVFSFNGNKIITTSGGGVIVTDDEAIARRVTYLATQAREATPHYEHVEVGFNYRLSNLLAAFGRGQIADLTKKVQARRRVNVRYREQLADLPVRFAPVPSWSTPNCWLTCLTIDDDCAATPELVRLALEEVDIESRPLWKPMHQQPVYKEFDAVLNGVSDALFARGLCLPSGSAMSADTQQRVIDVVRRVVR